LQWSWDPSAMQVRIVKSGVQLSTAGRDTRGETGLDAALGGNGLFSVVDSRKIVPYEGRLILLR
ncbi:MAG: hypothetical protein WCO97_01870, partial [bacterium]